MGRNHLALTSGDATNTVLATVGYNFRRLISWLRLLFIAPNSDRVQHACSAKIRLKMAFFTGD